jgi:hypothetical protein
VGWILAVTVRTADDKNNNNNNNNKTTIITTPITNNTINNVSEARVGKLEMRGSVSK